MTVNATDADDPTTPNGKIEYELLNGTDLFKINDKGIYIYSIYTYTHYHSKDLGQ